MADIFGYGDFRYRHVDGWPTIPPEINFHESPGVAVDSQDRVYVLTRGKDPVVVFDKDGNFLRSFGEGLFTSRTHGMFIGPDDSVFCVDDGHHTITQFSPEGKRLLTIGAEGQPSAEQHLLPTWQCVVWV